MITHHRQVTNYYSRTFQGLKLQFPRIFRIKLIFQESFEKISRTFQKNDNTPQARTNSSSLFSHSIGLFPDRFQIPRLFQIPQVDDQHAIKHTARHTVKWSAACWSDDGMDDVFAVRQSSRWWQTGSGSSNTVTVWSLYHASVTL